MALLNKKRSWGKSVLSLCPSFFTAFGELPVGIEPAFLPYHGEIVQKIET